MGPLRWTEALKIIILINLSLTTAQFTEEDALKTQAIARLRILVERAMGRVKEYRIWERTVLSPCLRQSTSCGPSAV